MDSFRDRAGVVLVTGGTGGIGAAICRKFVTAGAPVVFTYRSSTQSAEALATELRATAPGSGAVNIDLTDAAAVRTAIETLVDEHGAVQAVVHAAGPHVPMRHLSRVEPDHMAQQVTSDVNGFFNLMHAALPPLRDSRGSVVVISTAATTRYPKRDGLSSGPKAAVEALARGFAAEEGRFGVRVNCVGPGMLTDGMAERLIANGDLDQAALDVTMNNIPLRKFGTADDIAEAALFLASDRAGFITGQKLDVDGGYGV